MADRAFKVVSMEKHREQSEQEKRGKQGISHKGVYGVLNHNIQFLEKDRSRLHDIAVSLSPFKHDVM